MPKGGGGGGHNDPSDSKHEQKLQAVILADSFTSTFRPVTLDKTQPKVLCPLNNVTMLDYSIEFLAGAGVEELFVFCVHGAETVEQYVQNSTWTSSIKVTCVKDSNCTNAGDALRELDKRNLVQSDPFILMSGDVVTNVDIVPALAAHKARHKKDNSAIMTMLLKRVGGWDVTESAGGGDAEEVVRASPLRSLGDDLVVGIDPHDQNRILLFDSDPNKSTLPLPTSFFSSHRQIDVRTDMLDTGIDICSPDVLARFSDEFDYRDIRRQFVANSCAEEEEGLQNRIYAHILGPSEYAARIHDPRTYAAVSSDLLRRWCYPVVPDNLPSGYEKRYRYVLQRRYVYREANHPAKIGRSSKVVGPGMVGSRCRIGEGCIIKRTVIGNYCTIDSNVRLEDSHLWQKVTIEDGATVNQSILCDGCTIKKGAVVGKGCIVGKDCVIGEGIVLPDFTRVTLCTDDDDEDDDFGDFGSSDDDSGFSSSDEASSSEEEDDDDESDDNEEGGGVAVGAASSADAGTGVAVETDHDVVGKDGLGRVWKPRSLDDDDENSDYDDFAGSQGGAGGDPAEELVKSQSIGYDETHLFLKRLGVQEEEEDMFSDDEHGGLGDDDSNFGDDMSFGVGGGSGMTSSNLDDGLLITGRQRGVDVVKELKQLCLEHETSSPIENLAIELNSFKFSQNATYSDCATGASLAILERIGITSDMTAPKLVAALKKELSHWVPLFHKFCHGLEEENSIIVAMETAAVGGGAIGDVLGKAPAFRFMLQTLHQEEVVGEEAILAWAESRKKGDPTSAVGKLFLQEPTQEFIEWLQDESESGSEDDECGSSSGDESDED